MKRFFTASANPFDAPDLLNTTNAAKDKDKIAFELGMGDDTDLVSAGLQAKSNAALHSLGETFERRRKSDTLADLVRERALEALHAINEELDWLDKQIAIESQAIAENTQVIDFIQSLDESNVMGEDGQVRDDVRALLEEHGYNDLDGKDAAEIMIMLREIEIKLHEDNRIRQERIDDYEDRHGDLRRRAGEIASEHGKHMPPAVLQSYRETSERQPFELNHSVLVAAASDSEFANDVEQTAMKQIVDVETSGFTPPSA